VRGGWRGGQEGNSAQKWLLEMAGELGLPIFVVFVLLLWSTFRILNRATELGASPDGRQLAGWGEGLRSGLTGFLVAGCFISAQYEKMLWLAVFGTIVLGRVAAGGRRAGAPEARGRGGAAPRPLCGR